MGMLNELSDHLKSGCDSKPMDSISSHPGRRAASIPHAGGVCALCGVRDLG